MAARTERSRNAADQLFASGATTAVEVDRGDKTTSDRVVLHGSFADDAAARDAVSRLRAKGWAATARPTGGGHLLAWLRNNATERPHPRLAVRPPWAEDCSDAPVVVEIDPGSGFGAGAHPTTRMLLAELAGRPTRGATVLDVGCGSGVLGIAALALGAASATAIDIAAGALRATAWNAGWNDVDDRLDISQTPLGRLTEPFDIVVANIAATTLIELGSELERLVAPGGWLGLSGISCAQASVVAAAHPELAPHLVRADGDYVALVGVRSRA